jgi:effector-binding domain-containing protein
MSRMTLAFALALTALLLTTGDPWAQAADGPASGVKPGGTAANPALSTQPVWHLSPLLVKDVKEVPGYLHGSAETTLADIAKTLDKIFMPLMDKAQKAGLLGGPPIFVYHGATGDPTAKFTLDTGFAVPADTKPLGEFKVNKLPGYRAATAYFTGPLSSLGAAYTQFFPELMKAGYTPTGDMREVYLFWEGPDSANNVVEIQVGIK